MRKKFNLFKSLDKLATEIPISKIMVKDVKKILETDKVQKAINMMAKHSISGLVVCDMKDDPVGMVSEGDILKQVLFKGKDPTKILIKDIMSKGLLTIKPTSSIGETGVLMKKHKISKLPVIDNGDIIGYVTKSDLLEELNEIYYQNRRLLWTTVIITIQFIVIAILLLAYINK